MSTASVHATETPPEQRLTAGGVDLQIFTGGTGEPLLLLHDIEYLNRWQPYQQRLSERFRVLSPSHPGFGTSSLPGHFDSVDDLAYFYLDVVREIGRVSLVGMGLGGWIAAELAARCDHDLERLVLVDAVGIKIGGRTDRDIADTFIAGPEELLRLCWHSPETGRKLMRLPAAGLPEDELTELLRNRQSAALYGWSPFMHNPKLAGRLHRIRVPTLVLWGASDRVVSPDYGRAYTGLIPNARFQLIEQAGHYPYLEQPAAFIAAITGFLQG